uniref:Uncharacterized protein n=1 Tax=Arundo donax TaxID=35708 RepID=A0A0A9B6R5_ARUDO
MSPSRVQSPPPHPIKLLFIKDHTTPTSSSRSQPWWLGRSCGGCASLGRLQQQATEPVFFLQPSGAVWLMANEVWCNLKPA